VIGTSGNRSGATNPTNGNTEPADILEGIGQGELLQPQSLYLDQLAKRAQGILITMDEGSSIQPTPGFILSADTYSYGIGLAATEPEQLRRMMKCLIDGGAAAAPSYRD